MKKNFKNNASKYGYYFGQGCKYVGILSMIYSTIIISAGYGYEESFLKKFGFILLIINMLLAVYGFWRTK